MTATPALREILIVLCCCASWITAPSSLAAPASSLDCRSSQTEPRVIQTTLSDVPALVRMPKRVTLPPVLLWHGFGPPASERALMAALPLDDVPAIKVYLGLPMFGARMPARGMDELAERQKTDMGTLVFAPIVIGAADELAKVVRALSDAGCLRPGDEVGLFGFSAGGASALLALADRKVNVKAAVTLNASTGLSASVRAFERASGQTYKWTPASRELAQRSDAVGRAADIAFGATPPALLIIHGEHDQMLPPQTAIDLYESLLPRYERVAAHSRLQLVLLPDMAHAWSDGAAGDPLRARISLWFRQHL